MSPILKLVALGWAIAFAERMLFWLWLWQLKEYHFGRFRAHFSTHKGKKLIFNLSNAALIFLIAGWFLVVFSPEKYQLYWPLIWLVLLDVFFVLIAIRTLFKLVFRQLKMPVLTLKTAVLMVLGFVVEGLILIVATPLGSYSFNVFLFLISFLFAPLVVFLLVWLVQPFVVLQRNRILEKAQEKREKFKNLTVIGITGSYGKTSTKEFLAAILSEKFKVLKTAKHINAEIGIAQTILENLNSEHQVFIAEIGAYNRGKIKQVCQMLQPRIGILTGINQQHLATFGSQANIIKAKYELIESLPKEGLAIFNGHNQYCQKLYQKTAISKKIVSVAGKAINLMPWENENLAMAKIVAESLGMKPAEISRACQNIESLTEVKKVNDLTIIKSIYSANPDSLISHLRYLGKSPNKKIIIMPCLIELGGASKEIHQQIGQKIGQICNLAIITTSDRFKELQEGAQKAGMAKERIVFMEQPKEIFKKIKSFAKSGDIVLLESRLPEELIKMLCGD